jgi:hypothetical protein
MKDQPFKVVNSLAQGFAVAGPSKDAGVDLEFIYWGLPFAEAKAKADDLNSAPPAARHD